MPDGSDDVHGSDIDFPGEWFVRKQAVTITYHKDKISLLGQMKIVLCYRFPSLLNYKHLLEITVKSKSNGEHQIITRNYD